jgi:hypothetical protein
MNAQLPLPTLSQLDYHGRKPLLPLFPCHLDVAAAVLFLLPCSPLPRLEPHVVAVARNASYSQYWNASGKKKEKTLYSQCQSMLPGFLSTFHKYIIACARQSFLSQKLKENLLHI